MEVVGRAQVAIAQGCGLGVELWRLVERYFVFGGIFSEEVFQVSLFRPRNSGGDGPISFSDKAVLEKCRHLKLGFLRFGWQHDAPHGPVEPIDGAYK